MRQETFTFRGVNGQEVFARCWKPVGAPLGCLQIFHGMAEHSERYMYFAEFINSRGLVVYACDQRGHGRTGELNNSSCHLDSDGFNGIIKDQEQLSRLIKERHPGIPLFILGHSFGSFIAQEYIKQYGSGICGIVLSGSSKMIGPAVKAGYLIALISLIFGGSRPNALIDKLSFGSYNKLIKNPSGKFDWLSRDEDQVRKYENDRLCGGIMSTNFYYYFFKGLNSLYNNTSKGDIPKELPVLILSGEQDPVGNYGKGVRLLYNWYGRLGLKNLQLKIYKEGRHEMLNEVNREEVYQDIYTWLAANSLNFS